MAPKEMVIISSADAETARHELDSLRTFLTRLEQVEHAYAYLRDLLSTIERAEARQAQISNEHDAAQLQLDAVLAELQKCETAMHSAHASLAQVQEQRAAEVQAIVTAAQQEAEAQAKLVNMRQQQEIAQQQQIGRELDREITSKQRKLDKINAQLATARKLLGEA